MRPVLDKYAELVEQNINGFGDCFRAFVLAPLREGANTAEKKLMDIA